MNDLGKELDDACTANSDERLIQRVRDGDAGAYADLYERHRGAALATAQSYARNSTDASDFVADAFANVLAAIRNGNGPTVFFRAYLLTTLRRLATAKRTVDGRQVEVDDLESVMAVEPVQDPAVASFERDVVGRSFKDLPERWQAVLWYTEVDGLSPAAVSPMLGISANAVAALAVRAREGLKQAYLQNHISSAHDGCAEFSKRLGAYARGGLTRGRATKVADHLEGCLKCTSLLMHIQDVGVGMRTVIFPAVVGLAAAGQTSGLIAGVASAPLTGTRTLGSGTASIGGAVMVTASAVALSGALVAVALVLPGGAGLDNSDLLEDLSAGGASVPAPQYWAAAPETNPGQAVEGELPGVIFTTVAPSSPSETTPVQEPTPIPMPAVEMTVSPAPASPSSGSGETPNPRETPTQTPSGLPTPAQTTVPEVTPPATAEPTPEPTPSATAEPTPSQGPTPSPTPFTARGKVLAQNGSQSRLQIDLVNHGLDVTSPAVTFSIPRLWAGQAVPVTAPVGWTCVDSSTIFTVGSTCTAPAWAAAEARFLVSVMTPIVADGYFVKIDASADGAEKYTGWLRPK
ncbi:RNA polymerase sigma factor, sigma-70 family [Arthrobacter alpinus]|uniref:RNA polymerase sigma factor, sigma-70 family n=1 Tax=Arthrobacter alpinus TaxID=656366 RepID=A0A1H5NFR2_9MICC|nr:RNA polymerase sigma factor [Arthrobacter alpinus]SEE99538.1 RNA polymerase sigma factor, sigma-70 family [Arthrobacter alpinus]